MLRLATYDSGASGISRQGRGVTMHDDRDWYKALMLSMPSIWRGDLKRAFALLLPQADMEYKRALWCMAMEIIGTYGARLPAKNPARDTTA